MLQPGLPAPRPTPESTQRSRPPQLPLFSHSPRADDLAFRPAGTHLLPEYTQVPDSTPVSAVFAPDRHLAPKGRVFIDFVAEHFAQLDLSC